MFFGGMDILFAAIGVSIVARAVRGGGRRYRDLPPVAPQPARLDDPRVAQLQTEVDDLRAQVDRLKDAESFYAQLNAGSSPRAPAPPSTGEPPSAPPPGYPRTQ